MNEIRNLSLNYDYLQWKQLGRMVFPNTDSTSLFMKMDLRE